MFGDLSASFLLASTFVLAVLAPVAGTDGTHWVEVSYQPGLGVSWTASLGLSCSLDSVPAPEVRVVCTSATLIECWNPVAMGSITGVNAALTVTAECSEGAQATCTAETEVPATSSSCMKSRPGIDGDLPFVCHVVPGGGILLGYEAECEAIIW